jgi:two-component system nitrogen regulation response regulator GlnG/two-component system response regulator HydG
VLDSDGEYQRLGDPSRRQARFRLIAATNEPPQSLKHDLMARFTLRVDVPPLENRLDDVALLLQHLFRRALIDEPKVASRFADEARGNALRASPEFVRQLITRLPNGEIRGLENRLWQAMARSRGSWLQHSIDGDSSTETETETAAAGEPSLSARELPDAEAVRAALAAHGDNVRLAARALSLSNRHVLYRLLKKYGIELPTRRDDG